MTAPSDRNLQIWLVHKDNLDYGPFNATEIEGKLKDGTFNPSEQLINQNTREKGAIQEHPFFKEFCAKLATEQAIEKEQKKLQAQGKSKAFKVSAMALITLGLVAIGYWGYTEIQKKQKTKIVYRDRPTNEIDQQIKGLKISWKSKDTKKKKSNRKKVKARKLAKRDIVDLGDASQGTGGETLAQSVIQKVMQRNMRKLSGCILQAKRRTPSLREVSIMFTVKGNGKVHYLDVNGKTSGNLYRCLSPKMANIKFPTYNGHRTKASFTVSLES